jgi:hypothetical protein
MTGDIGDFVALVSAVRLDREFFVQMASDVFEGRPVRWAPKWAPFWDHTIQIFNASVKDRHRLCAEMDFVRCVGERALGLNIIMVFYSPRQTMTLYPEFSCSG